MFDRSTDAGEQQCSAREGLYHDSRLGCSATPQPGGLGPSLREFETASIALQLGSLGRVRCCRRILPNIFMVIAFFDLPQKLAELVKTMAYF